MSPTTSAAPPEPGVALLDLASEVVGRRRIMAWSVFACVTIAVAIALFRPTRYEAFATVMAAVPSGAESRLAGLASQFGLGDLAGARGGLAASPDLIAQLARSRVILDRVLDDTVSTGAEEGRTSVLELLAPGGETGAPATAGEERLRRARAMRELGELVTVTKQKATGSATVAVTSEAPALSHDLAQAVVRHLNEVLLEMGRSQAAEERRFVEERLREREGELRAAENALAAFLSGNRDYRSSPQLTFEHDRLQRVVTRQQQVVISLAESNEDAAIRAVRDTPALLVIEPVAVPAMPMPRRRILIALLGVIAGVLVGTVIVFATATIAEMERRGRPEWTRFRDAIRLRR
ncbi:MAG: hypothetical protein KJZ74_10460 [Gemmatimonadales bacterium]|nr:hypothetical protein [Gemmatimonadota bacterium]MCL4214327.1 hypothetical protein [Gemmatimonadales bacterium]